MNLGNNSTDLTKINNHEDKIHNQYEFIDDEDIIESFQKVFNDYNIVYKPHKKSKNIYVKFLLDKLYNSDNVPKKIIQSL